MLFIVIQCHSISSVSFNNIQCATCHSLSFNILHVIQHHSIYYKSFNINQYFTCHSLSISVIQHLVSSTQFLWVPQHSEVFWSLPINTVVHSKAWPFPIPHGTSWSFNTSSLIRYFILLSNSNHSINNHSNNNHSITHLLINIISFQHS